MNATSHSIIAAAQDAKLLQRAIALAAAQGIPSPQSFVESQRQHLVAAPIDGQGNSIASVYEYAASQVSTQKAQLQQVLQSTQEQIAGLKGPGDDPAYVTDSHITSALAHLKAQGDQ